MKETKTTRAPRPSEEGYVLMAAIFLLAIFTISLSIALPRMAKQLQRDRELETMQRGKQYIRAIKLYYKKFSAYPPNVDALVKTNEIRFLRKKYVDPTTGKEEWKPVLFGQNKAPTAMGFFGVPLSGSTIAGTGPSGGNGLQGLNGSSGLGGQSAPTDPNATQSSGSSTTTTTTGTSGTTAGGTSGSGQTFGGAGIIGFSPNSPKKSLMVYKKKEHYNEWEFVYDPIAEQQMMMGAGNSGLGSQSASPTSTSTGTGTNSTPTGAVTGSGSQ
jgi:type II secretory pathway pseudopilin PulG